MEDQRRHPARFVTTTYTHNGDGDRIEQEVGEVTTTYVLDTATPLTIPAWECQGRRSASR